MIKYFAIEYVEFHFNLAYSKSNLSCKFLGLFTEPLEEKFLLYRETDTNIYIYTVIIIGIF